MSANFTPQDDTGTVAAANVYGSLAEFKQYHLDRGNSLGTFTDPQIQVAMVRARDYLDTRWTFPGLPLTYPTQTTQFPRQDIYDLQGNPLTGVPLAVKQAEYEYALRALSANLFVDAPAPDGGRLIESERVKVDVIETETTYAAGGLSLNGDFIMPAFPLADLILRRAGLIGPSGRVVTR